MNFAIRPTTVSLPNKANAFGKSGPCICPVVAIRQGMNNILPFAPAAFPAALIAAWIPSALKSSNASNSVLNAFNVSDTPSCAMKAFAS